MELIRRVFILITDTDTRLFEIQIFSEIFLAQSYSMELGATCTSVQEHNIHFKVGSDGAIV